MIKVKKKRQKESEPTAATDAGKGGKTLQDILGPAATPTPAPVRDEATSPPPAKRGDMAKAFSCAPGAGKSFRRAMSKPGKLVQSWSKRFAGESDSAPAEAPAATPTAPTAAPAAPAAPQTTRLPSTSTSTTSSEGRVVVVPTVSRPGGDAKEARKEKAVPALQGLPAGAEKQLPEVEMAPAPAAAAPASPSAGTAAAPATAAAAAAPPRTPARSPPPPQAQAPLSPTTPLLAAAAEYNTAPSSLTTAQQPLQAVAAAVPVLAATARELELPSAVAESKAAPAPPPPPPKEIEPPSAAADFMATPPLLKEFEPPSAADDSKATLFPPLPPPKELGTPSATTDLKPSLPPPLATELSIPEKLADVKALPPTPLPLASPLPLPPALPSPGSDKVLPTVTGTGHWPTVSTGASGYETPPYEGVLGAPVCASTAAPAAPASCPPPPQAAKTAVPPLYQWVEAFTALPFVPLLLVRRWLVNTLTVKQQLAKYKGEEARLRRVVLEQAEEIKDLKEQVKHRDHLIAYLQEKQLQLERKDGASASGLPVGVANGL